MVEPRELSIHCWSKVAGVCQRTSMEWESSMKMKQRIVSKDAMVCTKQ